jgi:hypothetical protein
VGPSPTGRGRDDGGDGDASSSSSPTRPGVRGARGAGDAVDAMDDGERRAASSRVSWFAASRQLPKRFS